MIKLSPCLEIAFQRFNSQGKSMVVMEQSFFLRASSQILLTEFLLIPKKLFNFTLLDLYPVLKSLCHLPQISHCIKVGVKQLTVHHGILLILNTAYTLDMILHVS